MDILGSALVLLPDLRRLLLLPETAGPDPENALWLFLFWG